MTDKQKQPEEDLITLIDEEGNEELYHILFTFHSDDFDKSYAIIYLAEASVEDDEVELFAYSYTEDEDGQAGELQAIETEEEWDMIDEVVATFIDEEDL